MNNKRNYSGFVDLISNVREMDSLAVDVRVTANDGYEYGLNYVAERRNDFDDARSPLDLL